MSLSGNLIRLDVGVELKASPRIHLRRTANIWLLTGDIVHQSDSETSYFLHKSAIIS